ncbi:Ig-like domain-containing protein [Haloferula sp. A504]|uniref:Ig-like domain-containing protein n=1 Tax=Haloferula sp. A504 TaxID=3373601 RepID=UPI0031C6206F|nr:Ig-like domain-containing protein [Verrucomicrobiaceae bacterium E54]
MRNPTRSLLHLLPLTLLAGTAHAASIYDDSFNYGDATVAIGGLGAWSSGSSVLKYDHDGGLDHPAMSGETGGAMWLDFTDARSASDSSINFDLTTLSEGDAVWMAVLFQYVSGNTPHELEVSGGTVSAMGVTISSAGGVFVKATLNQTVNASNNTGLSLTDGTHLMLLRYTKGAGTSPVDSAVDLWINPADVSSPTALGTADWTLDSTDGQVKWGRDGNVLSSISATPSQQGRIDEIRLATTLADVIAPASDTTAPLIASTNPADDAGNVLVTATLSATFDETIELVDGGTITIDDLDGGADTLITLPDPEGRVSLTDQTVTITPDTPLATNTSYAVLISNDAVRDFAPTPNFFAGISDPTIWNFQTAADGTPPALSPPTSPVDDSTDVALDAILTATFDEDVVAASGNITVDNLSGGSDFVIPVTDPQVTVSGSTLTIDPTTDFAPGANYAVRIAAGALTDTTGNAYPGILNNTTWNFTSVADTTNPALVSLSPADEGFIGASGSLVATFDEPVTAGTGNITVKNLTQTTQTVYAATDPEVTVSGNQLTLTPGAPLVVGDQYAVQIAADAVTDILLGINFSDSRTAGSSR